MSGGDSLCRMVLLLKLTGLKEAPMSRVGPVPPRGGPLCRPEEAPVPRGGPLCQKVLCAERIGRGPCVGRRLMRLCRMVRLIYAEGSA